MTPQDILRQLKALEFAALALSLNAAYLRQQMEVALTPVEGESTAEIQPTANTVEETCKCPPKFRVVAPTHGHPSRTKCTQCGKEHD